MQRQELERAVDLACRWIRDVAQITSVAKPDDLDNPQNHVFRTWKGAIRGEYSAGNRRWGSFCPIWHSGQAVKALTLAAEVLVKPEYLEPAAAAAEFIFANQVWEPGHPDHGLILAFEDYASKVNTSAILECMDGPLLLAQHTGNTDWIERLIAAGRFVVDKMYMPEAGVFRDLYDPAVHRWVPNMFRTRENIGGRPLVEDAIFTKLYDITGDRLFLDTHVQVSRTLVAHQNPPGNWIDYGPCDAATGCFHPRHTYWWGLPLIETFRRTGEQEFLAAAVASGEFCLRAMRHDGGWIRGLYTDYNTDSFGHATSGAACAAILFLELLKVTGEDRWASGARKALEFCCSVQFTAPADPKLSGAILEKVVPPDGTDKSPYHLRDLGTIFFIIAAARYIQAGLAEADVREAPIA